MITFRNIFRYVLLCVILSLPLAVRGQDSLLPIPPQQPDTIDRLAPDFVTAYVVIADPGNVLYSILGHACLRLQCPTYQLDYIYSYESESVEGKVFRFLANKLKMGLATISPDDFFQTYRDEKRGMRQYKLNLPPEVKSELWRICDERQAQGMKLEYDYIKRGCGISTVYAIEDAIKAANRMYGKDYAILYPKWGPEFKRTLREIFYDNAPHGWPLFWCMTLVGGPVDNPSLPNKEKLIAPAEIVDIWSQSTIDGHPLLDPPQQILPAQVQMAEPGFFTPLVVSIILLILALLSLIPSSSPVVNSLTVAYSYLILAVQTLLGCLCLWLLLSPLPGSEWNWLILAFNPLPLLLWKWRSKWAIPYAIFIVIWAIAMLLSPHRIVEYAHILLALSFCLVLAKQSMSLFRQ